MATSDEAVRAGWEGIRLVVHPFAGLNMRPAFVWERLDLIQRGLAALDSFLEGRRSLALVVDPSGESAEQEQPQHLESRSPSPSEEGVRSGFPPRLPSSHPGLREKDPGAPSQAPSAARAGRGRIPNGWEPEGWGRGCLP